ncbi:MAG: ankyrin repeat domain-containing protein [Synergistaceae bacterium]|jgi:ankyrin repeat protein|nr:ankyrin repeat domain-containing protein [Synergistaceae bacterium]
MERAYYRKVFDKNSEGAWISAVRSGLDVYRPDAWGWSFFDIAIRWGSEALVKACVEMGADPNLTAPREEHRKHFIDENFAPYVAIKARNIGTLRALLDAGADVDYLRNFRWVLQENLFPEAEGGGDKAMKFKRSLDTGAEILKILRQAGTPLPGLEDANASFSLNGQYGDKHGYMPEDYDDLSRIWSAPSPGAIKIRIDAGADVRERDCWGWTALHYIAMHDYLYFEPSSMIKTLIDAGADVNARGGRSNDYTPLMCAAMAVDERTEAFAVIQTLLRNGADFDATYGNGVYNALDCVEDYRLANIMREIGSSASDRCDNNAIFERPSEKDMDFLTASVYAPPEELETLLSRGALVNARGRRGHTPLMFASVCNSDASVKYLIQQGADLNAKNHRGETALMLFLDANWDESIFKYFIDSGADVNAADDKGNTVFMRVAADNSPIPEIARMLVETGANVNERNKDGLTALDLLFKRDEPGDKFGAYKREIAKLILAAGGTTGQTEPIDEWRGIRETEKITRKFGLMPRAAFRELFADNRAEMVFDAIKAGLDPNLRDTEGETLFYAGIRYGPPGITHAFIEAGANVNEDWIDGGVTLPNINPIFCAVEEYNADAVRALIETGLFSEKQKTDYSLRLRTNCFPEGTEDGNRAASQFKTRLDRGALVLKTLRDAGIKISHKDNWGGDLTYTYVGYHRPDQPDQYEPGSTCECFEYDVKLLHAVSPRSLKLFLDAGADPDERDSKGRSAMHYIALDHGDFFDPASMARLLIESGAEVNARDMDGVTPLMLCAKNLEGRPEKLAMLAVLTEAGADWDMEDGKGKSAVDWAEENYGDNFHEKRLLGEILNEIRRVFEPNSELPLLGNTEVDLMIAACMGAAERIRAALSRGADVNAKSEAGFTPLFFAAAFSCDAEAVRTLIASGANVRADNDLGGSVLTFTALRCGGSKHALLKIDILRALVEGGADVNDRTKGGATPLFSSSLFADASDRSRTGTTPLMIASFFAEPESVKFLIGMGADIHARNANGDTALIMAAIDRSAGTFVKFLRNAGAGAPVYGDKKAEDVVKILIDSGAELNARNFKDKSALMAAMEGGNLTIAKILLAAGADTGDFLTSEEKHGWTEDDYDTSLTADELRKYGLNV